MERWSAGIFLHYSIAPLLHYSFSYITEIVKFGTRQINRVRPEPVKGLSEKDM